MSDQRPWWLGDDARDRDDSDSSGSDKKASDFAGQVTGWVTWLQGLAQQRIVEPHRQHTDPREHPTCVLCRTSMLVDTADPRESETIVWVPTTIDPTLP